jgi:hypothetical protein
MDKIMSTRMDEAVIQHIGILAKKLGTSKKAILENAVRQYAEKIEAELKFDSWPILWEVGSATNRQPKRFDPSKMPCANHRKDTGVEGIYRFRCPHLAFAR